MSRTVSPRMRKVNEVLREVIASEIVELKDPRLGFVTVTGVECSPDLRHARVFYSVLGTPDDMTSTGEALASARRRLQSAIGSQLRIKYTPVLEFAVDPSIELGARITKILFELEEDEAS